MIVAALLATAWAAIVPGTTVAHAATESCPIEYWYEVHQSGSPWYASIGSAAGKYNASTASSTLTIALSQTTQRSTKWAVSAGASLSWGIAKVEASTSYDVTNTTSTGVTVTDQVVVPGHYYGYAQPKVEYRRFHITYMSDTPQCGVRTVKDYGYLDAITAYPFFAECVATTACTPKP